MREGEMLRTTLAEEVAGREDDLHLKDGEIAMLKAQVYSYLYLLLNAIHVVQGHVRFENSK